MQLIPGSAPPNTTLQPSESARARRAAFNRERAKARAARRLATRTTRVVSWWTTQPFPRPAALTPSQLHEALGKPTMTYAAALRWLGWTTLVRKDGGKARTLWLPPGSSIRRRPPGGLRIYAY